MVFYKTLLLVGSLFVALFVLEATADNPTVTSINNKLVIAWASDQKPEISQKPKIKKENNNPGECIDRVQKQQQNIVDKLHDIKKMLIQQKNKKQN